MTTTDHPSTTSPAARDERDVRLAWVGLLSLPLFLILAFVLGSGIGTAMGVEEGATASAGVALVLILTVLVLPAVPTGLAWLFANRARDRGDPRGKVPAVVATVFAGAFVVVNIGQWLLAVILG
jgi:hypothetical protein